MIVLHAGVEGETLLLWGETPAEDENPPRSKRRKSKTPSGAALPFGAGGPYLSVALVETLPDFVIPHNAFEKMIVWLPTVDGHPIASSPLVAEPPESDAQRELVPWGVTALRLSTSVLYSSSLR